MALRPFTGAVEVAEGRVANGKGVPFAGPDAFERDMHRRQFCGHLLRREKPVNLAIGDANLPRGPG